MLPKQKSYIPRFALLLNNVWFFSSDNYDVEKINKESILRAERLSEYFISMAKLVKQDSKNKSDLSNLAKDKTTNFEKFKAMYLADKELNKTVVAEMLDVSRKSIYQWVKKIESDGKL
jgi:predicted transcriptional regulator YheO